jgi:hypothetical protein
MEIVVPLLTDGSMVRYFYPLSSILIFYNYRHFVVLAVRQIELKLKYPCTVLHQLSYLMENKVGGTSGAIYGIFFAATAKAFEV